MTGKVYIHRLDKTAPLYTSAVLRHLCRVFSVPITDDPTAADAVWVSICDSDHLGIVKEARQVAGKRPLVMGGFESFFGEPWLAWASHVVVGEGADFIEEWGRDWRSALQMPCVLTHDKDATANYNVRYDLMPLATVPGSKRSFYLAGRGCPGKCRFCATGWSMPYSANQKSRVVGAARAAEKAGLTFSMVSNDSPYANVVRASNAQSCRVRDYLADPGGKASKMLHFGIEGWTEDDRRMIGKPILDAEIQDLEAVTASHKQVSEWFFIADYPGWSWDKVEEFAARTIPAALRGPRIVASITYFDPCPHTPWAREPVAGMYCDSKKLFTLLNGRNKRIRTSPPRSRADSAWRTCFHRATPAEALKLGPRPNVPNRADAFGRFADILIRVGLDHLLDEQENEPCGRIAVTCKRSDGSRILNPLTTGLGVVQPRIVGYHEVGDGERCDTNRSVDMRDVRVQEALQVG